MTKSEIRHVLKQDLAAECFGLREQLDQACRDGARADREWQARLDSARLCTREEIARLPIVAVSPAVRVQLDKLVVAAGGKSIMPKQKAA